MKASVIALLIFVSTIFSIQSNARPRNIKNSTLLAAVLDVDGGIQIFINTRKEWTSSHRLTDSYTENEQMLVDRLTENLSLCNLEESTFEPCTEGRSVIDLKKQLENSGVEVEPSFEQWIAREINADY